MGKSILLSAIILLTSCAHVTTAKLPLPPEQTYPKIMPVELGCLSDETYIKLVKRDKMKTERIQTLREIIMSTYWP